MHTYSVATGTHAHMLVIMFTTPVPSPGNTVNIEQARTLLGTYANSRQDRTQMTTVRDIAAQRMRVGWYTKSNHDKPNSTVSQRMLLTCVAMMATSACARVRKHVDALDSCRHVRIAWCCSVGMSPHVLQMSTQIYRVPSFSP